MPTPFQNTRLIQLEDNVSEILKLLNEYETELIDEDDPGKRNKYRRRIERLKDQKYTYEEELASLQQDSIDIQSDRVNEISRQLQKIDEKMSCLLEEQNSLKVALFSHFNDVEMKLITPFTAKLNDHELVEISAILEEIDENKIPDSEVEALLDGTRRYLAIMQERNLILPETKNELTSIIYESSIDTKHALKVTVPIIPFILSYEGEIGIGSGINLREVWNRLIRRFK
jgi:tRNA/tmRNA/rRNA uracil-C5-methylase (TrmA/RlmC/RlmD family)